MMTAERPADTRMMGIAHAAFRRDLTRVRQVLTATPVPQGGRRQAVADQVLWLMQALQAHHTAEDAGLLLHGFARPYRRRRSAWWSPGAPHGHAAAPGRLPSHAGRTGDLPGTELGLTALYDPGELAVTAGRVLVCASPGCDFAAGSVPGNVRYAGSQLEDADGGARDGPWAGPDGRPLVLVGFGSTMMGQGDLLQRAAGALGRLPVRALVSTGPAVDPAVIRAPRDVLVRRWVRHAGVLPSCPAVLTRGGHGTVIKALAAGVPLVIAPPGGWQESWPPSATTGWSSTSLGAWPGPGQPSGKRSHAPSHVTSRAGR